MMTSANSAEPCGSANDDLHPDYRAFLEAKVPLALPAGFPCDLDEIPDTLTDGRPMKPHVRHIVRWAVEGGRRALFESFGLHKTMQQLLICDILLRKLEWELGAKPDALIVIPLNVRREFFRDAALLGLALLAQRVHGTIPSLRAGRPARLAEIEGREVDCQQEWVLSFDLPAGRRKRPFILDDGAWKKVRSIEDAGEVETWCLRVAEDASFTAEGCIVKNCPLQFDIVDRLIERYSAKGDLVFDPFCGLGTVPMRAILSGRRGAGSELNPEYFAHSVSYLREAEDQLAVPSLFELLDMEQDSAARDQAA